MVSMDQLRHGFFSHALENNPRPILWSRLFCFKSQAHARNQAKDREIKDSLKTNLHSADTVKNELMLSPIHIAFVCIAMGHGTWKTSPVQLY